MTSFDIALETSTPLHPGGDPGRFVSTHAGVIRRIRDRDGRASAVGLVRAYRVHADAADEAGETLSRCATPTPRSCATVYAGPVRRRDRRPPRGGPRRFGVLGGDILVLDYVLLSPRWRGLNLGLAAARRVIDVLGGGCGLVVSALVDEPRVTRASPGRRSSRPAPQRGKGQRRNSPAVSPAIAFLPSGVTATHRAMPAWPS